jgi:hypothetical protein
MPGTPRTRGCSEAEPDNEVDSLFVGNADSSHTQDVTASVTDPRAHDLRRRYGELFGGSLVPMPVKAIEREANVFAAELLMPEGEVRAAWGGDADATAARFGVSGEAMRWRLYRLGLGESPA